ncbi:MAG: hypothetical protein CMB74_00170 [Euryarchaeota archaeon]|nr:hypothetical protein [Euryarchaeota archaeon]|tara:strand:+ start:4126 stop:5061 length:936 start_codon:yes stop_codon:yes gene_type:complete
MGFARTAVGVLFISVLVFYLSTVGQLTDEAKWGFVGAMAVLAFIWINLGGQAKPAQRARRPAPAPAAVVETETVTPVTEETAEDEDLPAPVTVSSLDGATLRERKLAKIAAAEAAAQAAANEAEEADIEEVVVEVELEDVHVADEFVVDVSPESVEDADIEVTVRDRRERHEAIRERIKRRRMGQMADIRASTARMWEDHASGEDLVALLQTPGHGHSVLVEPEHPAPGHVYGATFVRIDEGRILKLRLPLDVGFESVGPATPAQPELPVLIGPDGQELPPLLSPDATPLALPPLPAASSALDALRKEMED